MQLAEEISFEFYLRKEEEIKFQKIISGQTFPILFFRKVPKNEDRNKAHVYPIRW